MRDFNAFIESFEWSRILCESSNSLNDLINHIPCKDSIVVFECNAPYQVLFSEALRIRVGELPSEFSIELPSLRGPLLFLHFVAYLNLILCDTPSLLYLLGCFSLLCAEVQWTMTCEEEVFNTCIAYRGSEPNELVRGILCN